MTYAHCDMSSKNIQRRTIKYMLKAIKAIHRIVIIISQPPGNYLWLSRFI